MNNILKTVLIVAGGTGTRMGTAVPKQFLLLDDKPVLMQTISKFYAYDVDIEIIVVLPANQHEYWQELCHKHHFKIKHLLVEGGETRFHSVKNGLLLAQKQGLIAVHDGVRPLVSNATIERCFSSAALNKSVIPVVPVNESVRLVDAATSKPVDRSKYVLVQTPQVFDAQLLHRAYEQMYSTEFTDDATVVEKTGANIVLVEGNFENIKITRPLDLAIAGALIKFAE